MSKRTWVIAGSVAVIGGVGFFLWWKYGRKQKATNTLPLDKSAPTTTPSGAPVDSGTIVPTLTEKEVRSFQDFANFKKWTPALAVDGKFGSKTAEAWNKEGQNWTAVKGKNPNNYDWGFVYEWMKASTADKPTFVFNGKTYNTKTMKAVS